MSVEQLAKLQHLHRLLRSHGYGRIVTDGDGPAAIFVVRPEPHELLDIVPLVRRIEAMFGVATAHMFRYDQGRLTAVEVTIR
jgi:hypothetical protein